MISRRDFLAATAATASLPLLPRMLLAGQGPQQFEGETVFLRLMTKSLDEGWVKLPMGEFVARIGKEFLETPYVGWTLERDVNQEYCFVTLEGLDCVTFFESSLGFARMMKRWQRDVASKAAPNVRLRRPLPQDLIAEVTRTRYWGGKVGDYASRIHYTQDWFFDNDRKGTVRNLTGSLPGAKPMDKEIKFMSTKSDMYRQLKAHPELIQKIKQTEAALTKRNMPYVPKSHALEAAKKLKSGDIIGLATTMEFMDIAHTGMIVVQNGVAHFMHASSTQKKVVLDAPLADVLNGSKTYTGFIAARPLEL